MPWAKSLISLLPLAAVVWGCNSNIDESPVVAQVYDYTLRQSDLSGLVGEGLSEDDSLTIVSNYIDQWIRQTVILAKAEKNVADNFDHQLKEYHNSLLTYAYERQIVEQLLDTNITEDQIARYYSQHQDEFLLKNSIVKAVYIIAPKKSTASTKLKSIITKPRFGDDEIVELERITSLHSLQSHLDGDAWIPFLTLQGYVPITTYNETLFLKYHRSVVLSDDSLTYYARILDYKITSDVSPIELQHSNIKSIILNQRKIEILNKLQADLLAEAENGGHVKRNIPTP